MMEDVFSPIARDASALFAVQIRLQKSLLALVQQDAHLFGASAITQSRQALARATAQLLPEELERLEVVHDQIAALTGTEVERGI